MRFPRSSGILLHPTSLPGRFGIGDLGPERAGFVDFLGGRRPEALAGAAARAHRFRRFALSMLFRVGRQSIADQPGAAGRERLVGRFRGDRERTADFPKTEVDFERVIPWKTALLEAAARG